MIINFDIIEDDVRAFADDSEDVICDRKTGQVVFTRNSKDIEFKVLQGKNGITEIMYDGVQLPYVKFLAKNIAQLDTFAERILNKRPGIEAFINGPAILERAAQEEVNELALDLLEGECNEPSDFCSKVVFITADAGHGKTALLRQYQNKQALAFKENKSNFLFWHVDLQGRQLLRLSEALMGDLGDLRLSGLWIPSIISLLKHNLLVLAIDGFDELAAEQGSSDALGALALLVDQLKNSGILVAASRRTFFDTEDYLKRSRIFEGKITSYCIFNQIHLKDWSKNESIHYLSNRNIEKPEKTYNEILIHLGKDSSHPLLTRPFLLSQVTNALVKYNISPSEFIGGMTDPSNPQKGVNSVIEAFVKREVEDKWKSKETGEPYLEKIQHFRILASVAEEMWRSQKDRLRIDIIETITLILLDEWGISDKERRKQIVEMIRMHAMLVIPDGNSEFRSFDHPEFRDYFTAYSLGGIFERTVQSGAYSVLSQFLSIAQISDATALYTFIHSNLTNKDVPQILEILETIVSEEWRPTYLQFNVGTLLPYIINNYDGDQPISLDAKVTYSSLVFENKMLYNTTIKGGSFLNTSFLNSSFNRVTFVNCQFSNISLDIDSKYIEVIFEDCQFNGVKIYKSGEEKEQIFAPARINETLNSLKIKLVENRQLVLIPQTEKLSENRRVAHRLLRLLKRITFVSEELMNYKLHSDKFKIMELVLPQMLKYGILEPRKDRKDVWILKVSQEEILKAEYGTGDKNLIEFWKSLES